MPYSVAEDHEREIVCVETWGRLSEEEFGSLLTNLMGSTVLREHRRILIDHTRLDKMEGGYQVSHPAISSVRDMSLKGDTFRMAIMNSSDVQEGLGRQTVITFESITGAKVDRRRFEDKETAFAWLISGDG
jgi:hypothetical protein